MPFIKVQKTKAYFKRFQVKYRRRREGKTDYYARKRLVVQAKNKYESPRYRFVVRFTNKYVITQIVRALLEGDQVLTSAYSSELPRYGIKVGLKNYAAAYCTGLLCARRLLTKLGMADTYEGNTDVTGDVVSTVAPKHATERTVATKKFYVAEVDDRRPFRALLDVGTRPTTLGARLFGALKGASDGGLDIPHKNTKFPGYDKEAKEFNAGVHKEKIFGGNIGEYMTTLKESDAEAYASQFSQYIKEGIDADNIEEMYESAHAKIREDPSPAPKKTREANKAFKKPTRRSLAQRKDRVRQKKDSRIFALQRDN